MTRRPLGTVTEIIESAGMEVSYAYEDLVFLEHSGFLLEFTNRKNEVLIHINEEVVENDLPALLLLMQKKAEERAMVFNIGRYYRLHQQGDGNIHIEFLYIQ